MKTPDLIWKNAPNAVQSWAIIMDDIDAIPVAGHIWNHWVVYNIPADKMAIGQNNYPTGTLMGQNSSAKNEYQGPCPPAGQLHHYTFRLFALNAASGLNSSGATAAELRNAMTGKVIDSLVLTGVFQQ
jgi:Raf kinase inhibitor-like YbhB/YbcL family protein